MAPFKALYGREPPALIAAPPSTRTPPDVAVSIRQRGELLVTLRKNLEKAQQRMRASANKHRRDVEFEVGERVLLKLQLYRQFSVAKPLSSKLSRRFYGPFEIIERIGQVAYRLKLPEGSRIHNVFHVSLLRTFVDDTEFTGKELPAVFAKGRPIARPEKLLDRRTVWCDGAPVDEGLLQWVDDNGKNPTWEPMTVIERRFPFLLEDKEPVMGGGGVDTRFTVAEELEEAREVEPEVVESFETVATESSDQPAKERQSRPQRARKRPDRLGDYI